MSEPKKKGRPKGSKDKKPRKTDGYYGNKNGPKNLTSSDAQLDIPEGYNSQKIRFMMEYLPTEPLDPNDIDEMERRFNHYLDLCVKYDQKISNQAAYAAIGIDDQTVYDWINRNKTNPARSQFCKKIKRICGLYREGLMQDGKVNPVVGIFWQKNYDGLRDAQEIVVTPNASPLGDGESAERLAEKYLEQTKGIEQKDIIELPLPSKEAEKET